MRLCICLCKRFSICMCPCVHVGLWLSLSISLPDSCMSILKQANDNYDAFTWPGENFVGSDIWEGGGSIALNWIVLTFLFFQQNNGFIWCGSEPVTVTPSINTTMLSRDPASMTQPMTSPTSASLLDVSICSGGQRITCNLSHRVYKRHSELLYW